MVHVFTWSEFPTAAFFGFRSLRLGGDVFRFAEACENQPGIREIDHNPKRP